MRSEHSLPTPFEITPALVMASRVSVIVTGGGHEPRTAIR
jgi:hypothetical protein